MWPSSSSAAPGWTGAPPPSATTPRSSASARVTSARSSSRNAASPSSTNRSAMLRPTRATMASSVSWNGTPSSSASARPVDGLARAGRPDDDARPDGDAGVTMSAGARGWRRGSRRGCGAVSVTLSPPNFSTHAWASTSATMASATTPAAGTAQTSDRWWMALAGSSPAMSTVSSERGTVEMGFIAARTRSTSPVDMPPSVPPDRPVRRRIAPDSSRSISSWACEPRRRAVVNPSPTSTPLIAWIPISAAASCASSRRSQWTCEPRPGGSP